jgi:TonB-dependent SusC/RagA subfamily outer membrane receptor
MNIAFAARRASTNVAMALSFLLLCGVGARAQTGRITGTAIDSSVGAPVSGINILINGTTLGAQTGGNGRYTINGVPPGTYTLEARRLGYAPMRRAGVVVTAGQLTTVDFTVQSAALHLQETVVTVVDPTAGTGAVHRRARHEDIPVPPTNAIQAIQGKIAGVSMVGPAQPGDGVSIQLRTPTSINKSTSPLIVVDGVILSESSADLNSLDIESVEVVKGAAGASLYGSRAANGVIQIHTSRGNGLSLGQTQFTFRSEYGGSSMSRDMPRARYHFYLTDASGNYVNAAGAIRATVAASWATAFKTRRTRRSTTRSKRFSIRATSRTTLNIAQNGEKTNFITTISHQKQDGVLRDRRLRPHGFPRQSRSPSARRRAVLDQRLPFAIESRGARWQHLLRSDRHGAGREPASEGPGRNQVHLSAGPAGCSSEPVVSGGGGAELHPANSNTREPGPAIHASRVVLGGRQRQLRPVRSEPVFLPQSRPQVGKRRDRRSRLADAGQPVYQFSQCVGKHQPAQGLRTTHGANDRPRAHGAAEVPGRNGDGNQFRRVAAASTRHARGLDAEPGQRPGLFPHRRLDYDSR